MIRIKTTLFVNWTLPIHDLFEEGTSKEEMKKQVQEHIKRLLDYHKIPDTSVKIILGEKDKEI